jgi:hypothetical protein
VVLFLVDGVEAIAGAAVVEVVVGAAMVGMVVVVARVELVADVEEVAGVVLAGVVVAVGAVVAVVADAGASTVAAASTVAGGLDRPLVTARYPVRPTMAAALVAPATLRARSAGWRRRPGGGDGMESLDWDMLPIMRSPPERDLGAGSRLPPNRGPGSERSPRNGTGSPEGGGSGWGP